MQLSQFIDHTILKPTTTLDEVKRICNEALTNGFYAVCIPPYFTQEAQKILQGTSIKICTVIDFPFGYSHYKTKTAELKRVINCGANEVDMVMNLAAFKDKNFSYLEEEVRQVSKLTIENGTILKIIIESGILSDNEITRCCDLYQHFNVDFLKTSTGYAEKGATVEAVEILRRHLPEHIQIKASGGIKTAAFAEQLINAGATRLGCSASVAIVGEKVMNNKQ